MVLVRLLTPEDIGIYTVGLAIIGIAHMVRDFGVGKYLVQEKNLTPEIVSGALGITIIFAWSMGGVVMLLAPYAAAFYNEVAVEGVLYVVGLNFFIIPFGAMAPALLKRSMSFGTLLKVNLSSTFVSVLVGVSLAYAGYGYMSMAWASVANVAASAVMAQWYLPAKYRVFPSLKNAKRILRFGRHIVGANLATEVNAGALDLLVGKSLGFAALGFLSRAQGFVKIYNNVIQKAINPVVSAQLAKTHRAGNELHASYLHTINLVSSVGWFILGFMGLMSADLIKILYGDQWGSAAPLASLLCLSACMGIPNKLAQALLVSTGKVRINFRLTVTFVILRIGLMVAFVDSGLFFLLSSFLVLQGINLLLTHIIICRQFGFKESAFIYLTIKNLLIVGLALLLPMYLWLAPSTESTSIILNLVVVGALSCGSWFGLVYLTKHPIAEEITNLIENTVTRVRRPEIL